MKVSVCSAVRNHSNFLEAMMASVVGQSLKDWEFIVVDDGSDEDIKSICDNWNDERIKYVRFPENRGVPHGINHALSLATGEYIQLISADERLELNKLLWQTGYLDEHPEVGGIWGLPQNGELGERPTYEQYALKAHNRSREAWIRTLLNVESIPLGGASWLVRRSVIEDIGVFDPKFYTCSDLEMFVRFFKKYEGRVFNYRWAWCEDNPKALHKNVTAGEFQKDLDLVRKTHPWVMPPKTGRVTVGIPVKNMEKYLPDTLKSLEEQTFKDFDTVIFDDGSTVPVPNATYRVEESVGPAEAQNQMLARCETEFFVVLAADDTVSPDFLEKCLKEFEADPWLEFVASQTDFMGEDGKPYQGLHPFMTIPKAINKPREVWIEQLYYGNQYFGCGMYRTKALKEAGGWDSSYGVIADYEVYQKLLHRGENFKIIEEDLTHTRIREDNRSILKTIQERLKLRQDYHRVKRHFYAPRRKVIIATPFYEMKGFVPYITSLISTTSLMTRLNIENEFWELSGDSYIDRAKNTLMNKFLEDPDATDLFMIDADMQWNPMSFMNMINLPEEIVMGSYPQKNGWDKWTAIPVLVADENGQQHPVGRQLADGSALIKAAFLAGGFIKLRRSAIEKYAEKYADLNYHDMGADPSYPDRKYIEFFTCERAANAEGKNLRWGEDRVFGKRLSEIGVEAWIFPNADIGHYGVKGWTGNYHDFIKDGVLAQ